MVPRLNVWGWGPMDADGAALNGVALGRMVLNEGAVGEVVVGEVAACCRTHLEYLALVSTVEKAGQVTLAK